MARYVFVLLILIATGFANTASADEGQPVIIASIFAKTGGSAEESIPNYKVVRMALEHLLPDGTILGRPVKLVEFDNLSTPIGSMLAAKKAVEAKASIVIGPTWSSHAMAMGEVLQQAGIPMIGTTTTAAEVTELGDFIFRACFTDELQAKALASFASNDLHAHRAGVLTIAGDVYSEGLANDFRKHFESSGGLVVSQQTYLHNAVDFQVQIKAIQSMNPDMIFIPGYAQDSALIIRQARKMGITLPLLGGDGWSAFERLKHLHPLPGPNYYSSHWHSGYTSKANQKFNRVFNARFGSTAFETLDAGIPCAYDATGLAVAAIRQAQSSKPEKIRDALLSLSDYQGATGTITFQGTRNPVKPVILLNFNNSRVEFIKEIEP